MYSYDDASEFCLAFGLVEERNMRRVLYLYLVTQTIMN